ncbi:MAG TPA: hypothetical protein PKE47_12845 [Verrucomicrobiota bacterium]|nr:hypothetical protein [Verrucomicrobiota bacterium]
MKTPPLLVNTPAGTSNTFRGGSKSSPSGRRRADISAWRSGDRKNTSPPPGCQHGLLPPSRETIRRVVRAGKSTTQISRRPDTVEATASQHSSGLKATASLSPNTLASGMGTGFVRPVSRYRHSPPAPRLVSPS